MGRAKLTRTLDENQRFYNNLPEETRAITTAPERRAEIITDISRPTGRTRRPWPALTSKSRQQQATPQNFRNG